MSKDVVTAANFDLVSRCNEDVLDHLEL